MRKDVVLELRKKRPDGEFDLILIRSNLNRLLTLINFRGLHNPCIFLSGLGGECRNSPGLHFLTEFLQFRHFIESIILSNGRLATASKF